MAMLSELQARRAYECRLTPDRALDTLDEAEEFLHDRGLLTRTTDSALPRLFEACHEAVCARAPASASGRRRNSPGSGSSERAARRFDPICRAELERMEAAEEGWARLLRHLAEAGPPELEDLQTELTLAPKELKSLRSPLERRGAVVARSVVYGEPHRHTSILARWDQVRPEPSGASEPRHALGDLVCAGVRAAVLTPEHEPARWFSWRWYWDDGLVEELVESGRLVRADGHLAADV
jgi:hypothetical protein